MSPTCRSIWRDFCRLFSTLNTSLFTYLNTQVKLVPPLPLGLMPKMSSTFAKPTGGHDLIKKYIFVDDQPRRSCRDGRNRAERRYNRIGALFLIIYHAGETGLLSHFLFSPKIIRPLCCSEKVADVVFFGMVYTQDFYCPAIVSVKGEIVVAEQNPNVLQPFRNFGAAG